MTIKEVEFHREVLRRAPIFTNWSIGALFIAFTAGTYTVVPHFWGITVGLILCCCFLISLFFPFLIKWHVSFYCTRLFFNAPSLQENNEEWFDC